MLRTKKHRANGCRRTRAYRRRVKLGRLMVPVELDDVGTPERLVALGFLEPGLEGDRIALGKAVSSLLDGLVLGTVRKL